MTSWAAPSSYSWSQKEGVRYDARRSKLRAAMPVFREKLPCVYIMASRRDGTLYTGVTSSLPDRVRSHKDSEVPGFTRRYRVGRLVYFEFHPTMQQAIAREKQIKKWYRAWKIELIELRNPSWRDLSSEVLDGVRFE